MTERLRASVLLVVNSPQSGPGRFATWLTARGVRTTTVSGEQIPLTPDGFDGVLLFGGGFMPDDYEHSPWLHRERALVTSAIDRSVPTLGICLGAQLIAQVAGGTVEASSGEPERGSVAIKTTDQARRDPLFNGLPSTFPAIENHRDRIAALPVGAVHLASSRQCAIQAFRVGDAAWGVQFHPEVGAQRLANWDSAALAGDGFDLDELQRRALEVEDEASRVAEQLLANWIEHLRAAGIKQPHFPVIDGHNDLPWERRINQGYSVEGVDDIQLTLQTDLPKLRTGGVAGQFWSVYVDTAETNPVGATLQQIDFVYRLAERYPHDFEIARTADEANHAISRGRIASLLGAEGGHSIGDDLAVLRTFARLGVRYMTLTHNDDTAWADSATGSHSHGGLTDRGREIVAEMERVGMLVDLSHTSAATMNDTLDIATAPVIFSHSCTRALSDHPRNVPDDVLTRLRSNGGVLMITFVPSFVSEARSHWIRKGRRGPEPVVTVSDVADHLEHAREVAGVAHIGIGSDFDGIPSLPRGLEDASSYPALAADLERRGWSPAELNAVASGNILRVLETADERHLSFLAR